MGHWDKDSFFCYLYIQVRLGIRINLFQISDENSLFKIALTQKLIL